MSFLPQTLPSLSSSKRPKLSNFLYVDFLTIGLLFLAAQIDDEIIINFELNFIFFIYIFLN